MTPVSQGPGCAFMGWEPPSSRSMRASNDPPFAASASCGPAASQGFKLSQCPRVSQRVALNGNSEIVATMLSLQSHLLGNPPDGWMVEEQSLDGCLQQVHQIVVPADVSQFVSQNGFELLRRKPCQSAGRQKNHRPKPSNHCWNLNAG